MNRWWLVALPLLLGCKSDPTPTGEPPRRGAPPPAAPSSSAAAQGKHGCTPATLPDPLAAKAFPPRVEAFCLDGTSTIYGGDGGKPIHDICDPFDGECEVYLGFGVERVVDLRYVDGGGTRATIDVHFSRFASAEGAYAMFTKRVVGENDPATEDSQRPLEAGAAASLGVGNAYVWRGQYLAELTYTDSAATEQTTRAVADKLLPDLARAVGEAVPGDKAIPAVAALLPVDDRVPLGVRLVMGDVLGVERLGTAAFGYHRTADGHRYRSFVIARDEAGATAALSALTKGGKDVAGVGDAARKVDVAEGKLSLAWVFARKGGHVFGIGDESRVHRAGMPAADAAKIDLTEDEKIAQLKKVLR